MQTGNGGPLLPPSGLPQQADRTRRLAVTVAVCMTSLAAVGAFSGRRLLSGTPLVLSFPTATALTEVAALDHYAAAVRRNDAEAAPTRRNHTAIAEPHAAVPADGPSIEQMARMMTAQALASFAADPSRVQLLPQAGSQAQAEPPAAANAGSGDPAAVSNNIPPLDIAGRATTAGEDAAQFQQSLSKAGNVKTEDASASAADAATVNGSRQDMTLQSSASALSAPAFEQPSQAADGGQTDAQEGPVTVLAEQALSPEDMQSALVAAAFAEGVIASRAAAAASENAPSPAGTRVGNLTVTLIIFFGPGRQAIQRVMQCYVERNLVVNGGIVSDVIWQAHDSLGASDLAFLQDIINRHPEQYRMKLVPVGAPHEAPFLQHYQDLDPDRYYVKMDDDVVWLADGAIEAMLEEKLRGRYLYLSANIVNHSSLGLMHARMGLLEGYLPTTSKGQPWVPATGKAFLDGTAAADIDDAVMGRAWSSWEVALIEHYNFFRHWREGSCDVYGKLPVFDLHTQGYVRWSITLILFKGGDLGNFTHGVDDDEALISQRFPEAAGRHCAAVGPALAVHYSYYTQRPGLGSQPEVLATYTRIAEETCGSLVG